jgi:hypothetical protein
MMLTNPICFCPIINGQYQVKMNLHELGMSSMEISRFKERYDEICQADKVFNQISYFDNYILTYRSESLFPLSDSIGHRKRVMIVFGNPAVNSIEKKMFFYSRQDGFRHPLWKKLEDAGLLSLTIRESKPNREMEANNIRDAIRAGVTSDLYTLGLTTFYSFPTPVIFVAK